MTLAVITCVPVVSVRENAPPVPIEPERLDVHSRLAVRLPSCESLAVPANEIVVPAGYDALSAGADSVTLGAVLVGDDDAV